MSRSALAISDFYYTYFLHHAALFDEWWDYPNESQAEFDLWDIRSWTSISSHCQSLWYDLPWTPPGNLFVMVQVHKKVKFSWRDNSSLTVKGLSKTKKCYVYNVMYYVYIFVFFILFGPKSFDHPVQYIIFLSFFRSCCCSLVGNHLWNLTWLNYQNSYLKNNYNWLKIYSIGWCNHVLVSFVFHICLIFIASPRCIDNSRTLNTKTWWSIS